MTTIQSYIVISSFIGLLIFYIVDFFNKKNLRIFLSKLFILSIAFCLIFIFFRLNLFNKTTPKAIGIDHNQIYFIIVLYFFMLIGMISNYLYSWFTIPKPTRKKKEFDFGVCIAPIFVSPLVFIPLYSVFLNENINFEELTTARLMIFFTAFQNGFFWKDFFDKLKKGKLINEEKK